MRRAPNPWRAAEPAALQPARDELNERGLDQPALVMTLLMPGVGKQNQHLVERFRRELMLEHSTAS